MGTAVTETQINLLKKLTRNLVLALDADAAGEEAMLRGVSYENILDTEVRVAILPTGKDPDDVIREDAKIWQQLVSDASPIVDYTFDTVTAPLDLTTARGKSLAVERLAPIVTNIKDPVRQAHYLQRLARLVRMSERSLEAALSKFRPRPGRRQVEKAKPETASQALRTVASSPLEEYCLALLLQHPELKEPSSHDLLPEYFQNSENREIFTAWQQADTDSLKEKLDTTLQEYLDHLLTKALPGNQIEPRYKDCVLRLRENFLKDLEAKRAERFALEVESGGAGADLARLEEEGIEPSIRLKEVFLKKVSGR